MTVDREQTRRDAETLVRRALLEGTQPYFETLAAFETLLAELEQAEQREAALVEALRQIVALPVPRAVHAIEIADLALAAHEESRGPS